MTDLSRVPDAWLKVKRDQITAAEGELKSGGEWLDSETWLAKVAPTVTASPMGHHHLQFWDWVDTVFTEPEVTPFAELIWPRGHAKSTSVELACIKWGCVGEARYILYVSETQDLADKHVEDVAERLESSEMERHYPAMSKPMLNKHGNSRGWRRNRVKTAAGVTIDAIGLDTAARGVKTDGMRPDVIILDDIDNHEDSPKIVAKKIRAITHGILPTMGDDKRCAVLLAQNLTHQNAIAKKIVDGTVDMLKGAMRIGPFPAVEGMRTELTDEGFHRIVEGEPTWEGMDIDACHARIDTYGLHAFLLESQQQITDRQGALWTQELINDLRSPRPQWSFDRIVVSIDPNKTGRGDDAGVVCIARATPPGSMVAHAYVLDDRTELVKPEIWRDIAAEMYLREHAGSFVVERTGSGDLAELTLRASPVLDGRPVEVVSVEAKMSKQDRARPVAQLYRDGRVHHCGSFDVLESQMTGWVPGQTSISPGGVDALVHGVTHLLVEPPAPPPPVEWVGGVDRSGETPRDGAYRRTRGR